MANDDTVTMTSLPPEIVGDPAATLRRIAANMRLTADVIDGYAKRFAPGEKDSKDLSIASDYLRSDAVRIEQAMSVLGIE